MYAGVYIQLSRKIVTHTSGFQAILVIVPHVVLCWLKEPGNDQHRQQIAEVSTSFLEIHGVLEVRAGQVVSSDREIVDDSFDVAILVIVPDQKRLAEYLDHPIHQKAKRMPCFLWSTE